MKQLGDRLLAVIDSAEPKLREIPEAESAEPLRAGGWSRKQTLGHLIDSASNNHQRFVRAALDSALEFPGYDQDGNVRIQAFEKMDWTVLVDLWVAYNRYLARVIAHLPEEKLQSMCRIGGNEPVTLAFLVEDYMTHLLHHLGQIVEAKAS